MKYKIPLLSSVAMSTTGCFLADPIIGEWTMDSADEPCMEYTKSYSYDGYTASYTMQICLEFDSLQFSVDNVKDAGLQGTLIEQQGTISMSYSYISGDETESDSYSSPMLQGDDMEVELIEDSENSYRITMEIGMDESSGESSSSEDDESDSTDSDGDFVNLEFNCTLSGSALECDFEDIVVEDDSYFDNFEFSGSLTFTK